MHGPSIAAAAWLAMTETTTGSLYTMLRPVTREIWIAPDGSGRITETVGEPTFFTPQDQAGWMAAGSPRMTSTSADFGPGGLYYAVNSDLPTEPILLRAVLLARAAGSGVGVNAEMFVLVGDSLRETGADSALRAALFEVAATIDGVQNLGPTVDRQAAQALL